MSHWTLNRSYWRCSSS